MPTKQNARQGGRAKETSTRETDTTSRRDQGPRLPRAAAIKAAIDPGAYYRERYPELPHLKPGRDGWTRNLPCPHHEDPNPSFGINLTTGAFRCFGCDANGGSVIDAEILATGCTFDEARAALAARYGIEPDAPTTRRRSPPRPKAADKGTTTTAPRAELHPIPPEALSTRPTQHPKHGTPSATWTYTDPAGAPVAFVCRFDPPNGRKQFSPQIWSEPKGWDWRAPPAPRPLYRLDQITARTAAPVLVCEGEKAADAAAELMPEAVAAATMNGANAARLSDLSPLAGRRVLIWPDADQPGINYARTIAERALEAGAASLEVLHLPDLPAAPLRPAPDRGNGWQGGGVPDRPDLGFVCIFGAEALKAQLAKEGLTPADIEWDGTEKGRDWTPPPPEGPTHA